MLVQYVYYNEIKSQFLNKMKFRSNYSVAIEKCFKLKWKP